MKEWNNKIDALKWCFDNLTPTNVGGKETYDILRQNKQRFIKNGKIGDNAVSRIFEVFGIQCECRYFIKEESDQPT